MWDLENEFLCISRFTRRWRRREGEMRSIPIFFSNRGKYVRDLDLRCRTIAKLFSSLISVPSASVEFIFKNHLHRN